MKKAIMRTFRKKTQAEGNSFASNIYNRTVKNDVFGTEQPLIVELKTRNDAFEAADAIAILGGTDRTAARNKCYLAVMEQLDSIADCIEFRSNGDTALAEAAGFETVTAKTPQVIDFLEAPTGLLVEDLPTRKGTCKTSWKKDPNATNYGILFQVEGETNWQNGTYSSSSSSLMSGLPSGKYITFKVYSIGRKGLKSDPSEPFTALIS
jgi:hypothetical protein